VFTSVFYRGIHSIAGNGFDQTTHLEVSKSVDRHIVQIDSFCVP